MGMYAMGCNFALVGATQKELEYVQNLINENRKANPGDHFAPGSEPGSVIMLDSFDTPADYNIGIDLSEDGKVRIKSTYSQRVGFVSYCESDRRSLLYQLVMMQIGYKFMDVPFNEIMDLFEKECAFKYIDCQKEDYLSSAKKIITEAIRGRDIDQIGLFIQWIDSFDLNYISETDDLINDLGIQSFLLQIVSLEDDLTSFQAGIFITK